MVAREVLVILQVRVLGLTLNVGGHGGKGGVGNTASKITWINLKCRW